jgi:hypothetical protein
MLNHLTSRREWLRNSACGFGYLALAGMLPQQIAAASSKSETKSPHFAPKAKRVIFVFLQGSPSHLDTFDHKPKLKEDDGKPEFADSGNPRKYLGSPWKFSQHGQSGQWISELHPHIAKHADKLCVIKSLTTDIPNHPQAVLQMHTGAFRFARPSMGAWVLYGLGTENQELPGFITLSPLTRVGGAQNYGNAFLPAAYQATRIGIEGQDIAQARISHISNPSFGSSLQRKQLDLIQQLHAGRPDAAASGDAELDSIVSSYELAFRMQGSVPKLLDISSESRETLDMYGIDNKATDDFGRQCLLARRFAEAGVRFIEITSVGWDHHNNLRRQLTERTTSIDQPVGALLNDLERRGLLKDTLVVFGGEFGRTASGQGNDGRDHNITGFSMWLAGGGAKGGLSYGATDDYGQKAVENKCHIYDLQATILHLLGLNHEQLTFKYAGRDFRLTDVHGSVLNDVIA